MIRTAQHGPTGSVPASIHWTHSGHHNEDLTRRVEPRGAGKRRSQRAGPFPDADPRTPRRAMRPPRQGAPIKTACQAVGISKATYYSWRTRGKKARDEPPPTLGLTRQGLIDLLAEADVTYPSPGHQDRPTAAADAPPPRSVPGVPGVHRKGHGCTDAGIVGPDRARSAGRSSRGTHNYHPHRQGWDRYHYGA